MIPARPAGKSGNMLHKRGFAPFHAGFRSFTKTDNIRASEIPRNMIPCVIILSLFSMTFESPGGSEITVKGINTAAMLKGIG
jgi:hypothetical protein